MNENDTQEQPVQDELVTLKSRADLMGISYHPSIGIDKLREKVAASIKGEAVPEDKEVKSKSNSKELKVVEETLAEKRLRQRNEATELIRIRLTCMNPAKKEWDGEIITVGNAAIGSLKKFIPFAADDGWHVPRIMLKALQERQCQVFTTTVTKNGVSVRKGRLIKEFSIEILDPLSQTELNELARRQAMADGKE